jgi:hypothetical protein
VAVLRAQVRAFPRATWWGLLACAAPHLAATLAVGAQVLYAYAAYGGVPPGVR